MLKIFRQVAKAKSFKASPFIRHFSSTGDAPDSFYDESDEIDKEVWDLKLAKATGGIQNLTTGHAGKASEKLGGKFSINDVQASIDLHKDNTEEADLMDDDQAVAYEQKYGMPAPGHLSERVNLAGRTEGMSAYVPPEYSNHSMDWADLDRKDKEPEELQSFVKRTDEKSMPIDKQGLVACPGKRQRRGALGALKCHLLDLDALHYTDIVTLRRFIAADSEILGKRLTGLCSKCQRKVARTVKRARKLGFISHLGAYHVVDADPHHDANKFNFHRSMEGTEVKVSKTIL